MHYCQWSVVTYLSIIGRLLRGFKVPVLFVSSGQGGRVLQQSAVVAVQPEDGLTVRDRNM